MIDHDDNTHEFEYGSFQFPKSLANPPSRALLRNAKKYERKDSEGPKSAGKAKKDKKNKNKDGDKDETAETKTKGKKRKNKEKKSESKSKKAKK